MNPISIEQELASLLSNESSGAVLKEQLYDYKSIFLSRVYPDSTNPRFFPAVIMSDKHAYQLATRQLSKKQLIEIYDAKDKIVIGKSCIVNCFQNGTNDWRKANKSIESILELGQNVSVSEIIQVPTIYPINDGDYRILTGHRRFFAIVYANGIDSAAHFKVYQTKPTLRKTKQFQENASREDLPQYGKLRAFQDAILEIEALSTVRKRAGKKGLTVKEKANTLGISMGAFDNYSVLTRYPAVIEAYENGSSLAFTKMKKKILHVEKLKKVLPNDRGYDTKVSINSALKKELAGVKEVGKANLGVMEPRNFEFNGLSSPEVLKKILTEDMTKIDVGVDWNLVNWNDRREINSILSELILRLTETSHA